jgi:hypothetical protein
MQGMRQGQNVKVLTSCPSCLQGLARFSADTGAPADYIVVEQFVKKANAGGIERVLL